MTRNNNDPRRTAGAVFFSALLVISMVAIGFAGFAGSGAAQSVDVEYDPSSPWHGQDVTASGADITPGEYDLRRVTDSNGAVSSSTFVEQLETEDDAGTDVVVIDTSDLSSGDYFLRGGDLPYNPDMEDTFEVRIQTLDADFDDGTVADTGGDTMTDLEIDSNRGTYTLNVSADGDLDNEELFEILAPGADFDDADPVAFSDVEDAIAAGESLDAFTGGTTTFGDFNVFVYADGEDDDLDHDEKVGMYHIQDTEAEVDFVDIDDGSYVFQFDSIDTEATASEAISVSDVADAELEFADSTADVARGGVVAITIEANNAADSGVLVIGNVDDYGYQLNVTIDDFGDNDEITLYFNTYTAGQSTTLGGTDDVVWLDEDDADDDASLGSIEEHPDSDDLAFILSEGDYDMQVLAATTDFADAVDSPDDIGSLIINARETTALNVWTASDDTVDDLDEVEDVLAGVDAGDVTQRDLVAQDDWVIHELDATGLDGIFQYMDHNGYGIEELTDPNDAALFVATNNEEAERVARVRLRETRDSAGPNVDRRLVDWTEADYTVITTEGESAVFIAVNTDSWNEDDTVFANGNALDDDVDYEFTMSLRIEDEWLLEYDPDEDASDLEDHYQLVEGTYDVDERVGEFARDPYNVTPTDGVEIVATTNIAPGSEVDMRIRSTGDTNPSFIKTQSGLVVTQDGTVSAEFDFSDQTVGDEFDLTLRSGGFPDMPEASGFVVEAIDEETEETETEETEQTETEESETEEPATDEPETEEPETEEPETEETEDDTPGFGAVVALVALIAAALLATRRRRP